MVHVHDGSGHAAAETFEVEKQLGWADFNTGVVEEIAWQEPKYNGLNQQQSQPNLVNIFFHVVSLKTEASLGEFAKIKKR